jgi:hypothetical protein
MNTAIPGPGEDGYAMRDEESAAEALGYPAKARERSDEDDERAYFEAHPSEYERLLAEDAGSPLITNGESYALYLGARALAEVAAGLAGRGQHDLAGESARSAAALDDLQRRSTVAAAREQSTEQEAER